MNAETKKNLDFTTQGFKSNSVDSPKKKHNFEFTTQGISKDKDDNNTIQTEELSKSHNFDFTTQAIKSKGKNPVLESKFSELSSIKTADTSNKLKNKLISSQVPSEFTSPTHQNKADNIIAPSKFKTSNQINNSSYNNSDKKSKFNLELSDKKNNIYNISKNEQGKKQLTKTGAAIGNMIIATGKIKRPTLDKPDSSLEFHKDKFENEERTNNSPKRERKSLSPDRLKEDFVAGVGEFINRKNLLTNSQKLKLIINEKGGEGDKYIQDDEGNKVGLQRHKSVAEKTTFVSRINNESPDKPDPVYSDLYPNYPKAELDETRKKLRVSLRK